MMVDYKGEEVDIMKSITLITKGKNTCDALKKQLNTLLGDKVSIKSYCIDDDLKYNITDDLILFSSRNIYEHAVNHVDQKCPFIIARRSINYYEIDKLLNIPPGTEVLLVNDLPSSTYETISVLKIIGIDHIKYHPFFPGIKEYPALKLAVTPGELEIIPDFVEDVIDIKTRNIDFVTMIEIYKNLGLSDEKAYLLSAKYIKDIIDLIKKIKSMADINDHMKNELQTIINTVNDGIIALDENENVSVFNPIAEEIFGLANEDILGKKSNDKSIEKTIFSILKSDNVGIEKFEKINGRHVVVNSSYIKEEDIPTGTVYTIKDVTEIQRLEEELRRKLISQQYYARYTFKHIAGESESIENTKSLAKKIAKSNSPILIQGESGTGKELFSQAIHNASSRKNGPFVAVNFAALTESLIESELFGYDEGAFTGAKKGGMPGLFEQAHGGTIFLDEIGDAPVSFQIRLLRVLQEKQVRRIGGSKVIPIDVRVISATNKDLKELIEKGYFRQDLYYRLNVLPLKISPLRDRKRDIMILAQIFYSEYFKEKVRINVLEYFKYVKQQFLSYDWPGNIRELHNVVEYLTNICPDNPPEPGLLPEELKLVVNENEFIRIEHDNADINTILEEIKRANECGNPVGRRSLSKRLGISEGRLRKILGNMEKMDYINVRKGKKGLELSERGRSMI